MEEPKVYPACRYHAALPPIKVHSAEQDESLDDGWQNTPFPPPPPPPPALSPLEALTAERDDLAKLVDQMTKERDAAVADRDELAKQLPKLRADLLRLREQVKQQKAKPAPVAETAETAAPVAETEPKTE
jgi:hypothetical protein